MTLDYGGGGFGLGLYDGDDDGFDFDDLTKYYIGLLIIQYFTKVRARDTVGVSVRALVADNVYQAVSDGFDLDSAVGAQLDILASYRGAQRTVFGLDLTRDFMAFPFYDDPDVEAAARAGFALYDDAIVTTYFLLYADGGSAIGTLTDDELRRVTKFLARTQSRYLSAKEIDDIMFEFFADKVNVVDNQDMTVTYIHDVGDPDTLFGIIEQLGYLPRPAGVEVLVV